MSSAFTRPTTSVAFDRASLAVHAVGAASGVALVLEGRWGCCRSLPRTHSGHGETGNSPRDRVLVDKIEAAAFKAYPNCKAIPCDQFEAAFKAVELWVVDKAILPIENSLGGSIHRNYDLLLRHKLHIVGEVKMAVDHCLLAVHGTRIEDVRRVLSHQQALPQCEMTLSKLGVARESVDDTAAAAQFIASKDIKDAGTIASARAAEINGLNILAERIQDDHCNITRFLILARDPIIPRTDKPFKAYPNSQGSWEFTPR